MDYVAEPVLSTRDDLPVVCVKDETLWHQDPRTARFYKILDEDVIERIYNGVVYTFWEATAPSIAEIYGYDGIYSAGRSNGWLGVTPHCSHPDNLAQAIANRDNFIAFAKAIDANVHYLGEVFVMRLGWALDELERRRNENTILGEN